MIKNTYTRMYLSTGQTRHRSYGITYNYIARLSLPMVAMVLASNLGNIFTETVHWQTCPVALELKKKCSVTYKRLEAFHFSQHPFTSRLAMFIWCIVILLVFLLGVRPKIICLQLLRFFRVVLLSELTISSPPVSGS